MGGVRLGRRYRDVVTGFTGIATSVTEYLQGCRRVGLERLGNAGDKVVVLTFDEPNLEEVDAGIEKPRRGGRTGGPRGHESLVEDHA